jgi:hypothetical protein
MALLLQELPIHKQLASTVQLARDNNTPIRRHLQSAMILDMAGSQPQEMIQFEQTGLLKYSCFWNRHFEYIYVVERATFDIHALLNAIESCSLAQHSWILLT